jgi:arylformamidase
LSRFEHLLTPGARIIYETGWHREFGQPHFFDDFPSLTQDAAHYLIARRIRLLGMDTPTPSRDWLEVHRILLGRPAEVVVVESLAHLDQLPDQFTFIGFPLLFTGRDGSPIRAVGLSE